MAKLPSPNIDRSIRRRLQAIQWTGGQPHGLVHMGVDHRGLKILVAQEQLYRANVGALCHRCVANECRSVCTLACLCASASCSADLKARWVLDSEACQRSNLPVCGQSRMRRSGWERCRERRRRGGSASLVWIAHKLNIRPRKRHGYDTPLQKLFSY